jgi:hypothetical protein
MGINKAPGSLQACDVTGSRERIWLVVHAYAHCVRAESAIPDNLWHGVEQRREAIGPTA